MKQDEKGREVQAAKDVEVSELPLTDGLIERVILQEILKEIRITNRYLADIVGDTFT